MNRITVGLVSLDGQPPAVLGQYDEFERWNGWLCPWLDPLAVVTVIDVLNSHAIDELEYQYDWRDDGALLLTDCQNEDEDGYEPQVLLPDSDGLYQLGAESWIWSAEADAPYPEPLGVFRSVSTRGGEAQRRDGEPYFDMNRMGERPSTDDDSFPQKMMARGGELYEVQFADGAWMLARAADLVAGTIDPAIRHQS
ncbi:hypothetical protein AERO_08145 [Aeromicrobium fastidiosum]|uniref:hypothetical protein n=1 Tax=Aeromicrobium fastidiosum TaxID=52699 RepID=UPI002023684A|nr:hypothetical protein [Aeromicrobium fastidiosum]MCL8251352.1 hypothetical protein [Aeromicrobium fastidiosum]